MKLTMEVDCTPVEARQFFGLPDVTALNDALVAEMTARMQENMSMMSPDAMVRAWMAYGGQAQDAFLKLMSAGASSFVKGPDSRQG